MIINAFKIGEIQRITMYGTSDNNQEIKIDINTTGHKLNINTSMSSDEVYIADINCGFNSIDVTVYDDNDDYNDDYIINLCDYENEELDSEDLSVFLDQFKREG